jgi:transcriptional regulator with XRE-family HTH domain
VGKAKQQHPLTIWRAEHGKSQEALAKDTALSQGMISHIERFFRTPRKDVIEKLSAHTGLPTDAFVFPERYAATQEEAKKRAGKRKPRKEKRRAEG